mmetsp:Transcript_11377/g.22237  ORF Transcript_11377/g.22237 Transcript_11377/m.22237 type:complete len:216 (+) Transcript_11377:4122-4769(+)
MRVCVKERENNKKGVQRNETSSSSGDVNVRSLACFQIELRVYCASERLSGCCAPSGRPSYPFGSLWCCLFVFDLGVSKILFTDGQCLDTSKPFNTDGPYEDTFEVSPQVLSLREQRYLRTVSTRKVLVLSLSASRLMLRLVYFLQVSRILNSTETVGDFAQEGRPWRRGQTGESLCSPWMLLASLCQPPCRVFALLFAPLLLALGFPSSCFLCLF